MILSCGECLIDMIAEDTPNGRVFRPLPGGAVMNTARALARLGVPSGFFSGLSTDLFGAQIAAQLDRDGVDISLCARSDRPTTLAFVTLTDGQADYTFYDEETAGRCLLAEDLPQTPHPQAAFFGGISLVSEPSGTTYEVLFHKLHEAGVPLMIDPNIRPGFVRNERVYRKRLERMIESADIVKLSDEDLSWLMADGSVTERAEAILERGPSVLIITEGARGARVHTAAHEVMISPRPVSVVDTVGAGDTFNAGFLAALHDHHLLSREALVDLPQHELLHALETASRAAAHVVGQQGATPPRREDIF